VRVDRLRSDQEELALTRHVGRGLDGGSEFVLSHLGRADRARLGKSPINGLDCRSRRALGVSLTKKSAISRGERYSRMRSHSTNTGRGRLPSRAFQRRRFPCARRSRRVFRRSCCASRRSCSRFLLSTAWWENRIIDLQTLKQQPTFCPMLSFAPRSHDAAYPSPANFPSADL
jgi:hypothetical protein